MGYPVDLVLASEPLSIAQSQNGNLQIRYDTTTLLAISMHHYELFINPKSNLG
jgi:hypothetical protein